jgi:hypothetical protein
MLGPRPMQRWLCRRGGADDAGNERKVVDNIPNEGDRIDQEAGYDKEDRDEQRLAKELQFRLAGLSRAEALTASLAGWCWNDTCR